MAGQQAYEIVDGVLLIDGRPSGIPKGLLFVLLARAGWTGKDGPISPELIFRLRTTDPRLRFLYLRPDQDAAA